MENVIFSVFIGLEDVNRLEEVFAKRVPEGWLIPLWLVNLRKIAEDRFNQSLDIVL